MEQFLGWVGKIADQGLLGTLLVIMGYAYWLKDKKTVELRDKIQEIQEARLKDAIAWKDEALRITNKVNDVIATFSDLVQKGS